MHKGGAKIVDRSFQDKISADQPLSLAYMFCGTDIDHGIKGEREDMIGEYTQ